MHFDIVHRPIAADDAALADWVATAPVPPLLASIAHLTGDLSLLRDDLLPNLNAALLPDNGYSADQLALARSVAVAALGAYRDRGSTPAPPPSPADLRRMVEFVSGGSVDDDLFELLCEELSLDGADTRAPHWHIDEVAPERTVRVAIIGAGMSGLIVAHRLRQVGADVVIYDKNPDVGGTWLENRYPGCRVDIQNHSYSYTCAQTADWPGYHSAQPVLLEYFQRCADYFGLRPFLLLGVEVTEARFDDADRLWTLDFAAGASERFDLVISAVGQLNRPKLPDIAGRDLFARPAFHSARWPDDLNVTGKRVGVIGTGASAAQFIPWLVERAAHVTVFQRTPPWLLPVPYYTQPLPDGIVELLRHVPQYNRWDRLWSFARTQEGLLPFSAVDPSWSEPGSVSAANHMLRDILEQYYAVAFPDPELRAKVTPSYPPIAKRVVVDDGSYPRALQAPNADLVTDPIDRITGAGVVTADGAEHSFDVLVYGTGFEASKFLTPMRVRGVAGAELHERWGGDARAYLGITVPGFPNFFMMYGPNTNIVINGSIIYFSECETTYIVGCVRELLAGGHRTLDCRPEVHDAHNERVDAGNLTRAWGVSDVNTWYRNEHGRIAQNWPFNLIDYWRETKRVDPADYVFG